MSAEIVPHLVVVSPFDALRFVDANGVDRWSARDLMPLLGYAKWQNFGTPLGRARQAMTNSGNEQVSDHFMASHKMVDLGSGALRPVSDVNLSREAAYLVAMNCDPNKGEVAFCQRYFAQQTRRAELAQVAPQVQPSALSALNLAVQVLNEHETRLASIEQRMVAVEARPAQVADRSGSGFVSVLGWCRTHGLKYTSPQMGGLSRRCGRKSHEMNLPVGEIHDERWGVVKTYRVEVLAEVIGTGAAS